MKKLIALLEKTGVGFVTGNYKSFSFLKVIEENISMPMTINFSVENEYIGEYSLLIEKVVNSKVYGVICHMDGKYLYPFPKINEVFSVILTPNKHQTDIGTFMVISSLGKPSRIRTNIEK